MASTRRASTDWKIDTPVGVFPDFDADLFERAAPSSTPTTAVATPTTADVGDERAAVERLAAELDQQRALLAATAVSSPRRAPPRRVPAGATPTSSSSSTLSHRNGAFVEQLLRETKLKTKRLLLAKMGKEALHLGHADSGIQGVEVEDNGPSILDHQACYRKTRSSPASAICSIVSGHMASRKSR